MEIAAEYNGAGALQRRYVRGPGVDETVVWYEGAGTGDRRYLSTDELGSIVTVADGSGASIADNTFDEYGRPGAGNLGRFQYTGQAWLPAAGLYHYKARAYSASLGRFLQTDPIGFGGELNFYTYVGNDPLNFIDPFGLQEIPTMPPTDATVNRCAALESRGLGRCASIDFFGVPVWSFVVPGEKDEIIADTVRTFGCPAVKPGSAGTTTEKSAREADRVGHVTSLIAGFSAFAYTDKRFSYQGGHNDAADAHRHFVWNFNMTRTIGADRAAALANAHEVSAPNDAGETAMDLYNNAVGRAMAADRRFDDSKSAATVALAAGCLQTSPG